MNLIELLKHYRNVCRAEGRVSADKWLQSVCSSSLIRLEIRESVSDEGKFISGEGYEIHLDE